MVEHMRSGQTLIRVAKHRVEELQKQLAELQRSVDDIDRRMAELEAEVPNQKDAALPLMKEGYLSYGSYAQWVIERRQSLQHSREEMVAQVESLRGILSEAFEELKKFEKLEERRLAREFEADNKRNQAAMDEIALRGSRS